MSESSGHAYLSEHQLGGESLLLDVETESRSVLAEAGAAAAGHAARTLVKEGPLRVLILGFKPGSALREHSTPGPLTIHCLAGTVTVTAASREQKLDAGKALLVGASVKHSLAAGAEAVLLLTIAWPQGA
jgi:quercetin dioxygenase-like cupin family protein